MGPGTINPKVFRDSLKEHRGHYFVEYKPADVNSTYAIVNLVFIGTSIEVIEVRHAMEEELKHWLNRFAVPAMISACDAKDRLIHLSEKLYESHLMGYIDFHTGNLVHRWGLFNHDELPSEQVDADYLKQVYASVPYRVQEEVRQKVRREARARGRIIRLFVFFTVGFPVLIEIVALGVTWLGHLLAGISITIGLYKYGKSIG